MGIVRSSLHALFLHFARDVRISSCNQCALAAKSFIDGKMTPRAAPLEILLLVSLYSQIARIKYSFYNIYAKYIAVKVQIIFVCLDLNYAWACSDSIQRKKKNAKRQVLPMNTSCENTLPKD